MKTNRSSAIEAVIVLNYLIADLIAGTIVFIDYRERYKSGEFNVEQLSAVQRMCFSHLALSLFKLSEFWEHYHQLLSEKHHADLKELNRKVCKKGVKDFRNKISGHIWDKKSQKPLMPSEMTDFYDRLIGDHADIFLSWINNPSDNTYPNTVVSVVETIRDSIAQEYSINPDEIIER